MSKFKVGDRVRIKRDCSGCEKGKIYTLHDKHADGAEGPAAWDEVTEKQGRGGCSCEDNWELIEESQYQPITPKVGEKYRVIKPLPYGDRKNKLAELGLRLQITNVDKSDRPVRVLIDGDGRWLWKEYLTTEYLELVSEGVDYGGEGRDPSSYYPSIGRYGFTNMMEPITINTANIHRTMNEAMRMMQLNSKPLFQVEPINKQSIITKGMNFIKKLTQSADDKALEKAGFLNQCGELTVTGKDALISLVFKEKKAELVKLAEEVTAEIEG